MAQSRYRESSLQAQKQRNNGIGMKATWCPATVRLWPTPWQVMRNDYSRWGFIILAQGQSMCKDTVSPLTIQGVRGAQRIPNPWCSARWRT